MIKKKDQMRKAVVEKPRGGSGVGHFTHILEASELKPSATMFAEITLEPGGEVGYHDHVDDAEIYYILSGTMEVNDNGTTVLLEPGDAVYTTDGEFHGIRNAGDTHATMLAVIIR